MHTTEFPSLFKYTESQPLESFGQDKKRILRYIHIGKCGGSAVREALKLSLLRGRLREKYYYKCQSFHKYRCPPTNVKDVDFLVSIRHPLERVVSAYSFCGNLVSGPSSDISYGKGAYEFFLKYPSLDEAAFSLYDSRGIPDRRVFEGFFSILHIKQSILYHLGPVISQIKYNNIIGVICQHRLEEHCQKILGIEGVPIINRTDGSSNCSDKIDHLSVRAKSNLRQALLGDFQCIENLYEFGLISQGDFARLMRN